MKIGLVATLGVASLFALACADSSKAPTDPGVDIRMAKAPPAACDGALTRAAKAQLADILGSPNLNQAQTLWAAVESACTVGTPDAANSALMAYVDYVRGFYPSGFLAGKKGATKEGNFIAHLNTVFPYVGYAAPNLPVGAIDNGILAVITQSSTTREYQKEHLGAFKLAVQNGTGDQRALLFAMYPTSAECLTVDNLEEYGNCVQLNSYPASTGFSPSIKVGICTPEGLVGAALALGHETANGTEIAGKENYPSDCHASINVASNAGMFERAFSRLASIGRKTFGVQRAYAADKGLGGIGSTLSPWGILESQVFAGSFNVPPNTIGSVPVNEGNFTFTSSVTAPGSIQVQSSLGNSSGGSLVVLSQGGGACANCGGLFLRANIYSESGVAADDGVYQVNWKSVQAAPSVKGAPFVIRDGSGRAVATLRYATVSSANQLYYNDVLVGTWTRNVEQSFTIIVDLNANTTTLTIDNAATPTVANAAFHDPLADGLASIAAEFNGIDSGVMGWDEIGVQRLSDQPPPSI